MIIKNSTRILVLAGGYFVYTVCVISGPILCLLLYMWLIGIHDLGVAIRAGWLSIGLGLLVGTLVGAILAGQVWRLFEDQDARSNANYDRSGDS